MTWTPSGAVHSALPDLETLTAGLASVLDGHTGGSRLVVLDRRANLYASEVRSEIVTCRAPDGRELRLLCKYETSDPHSAVAYEARVYREILQPLKAAAPGFYGSFREPATGWTWLILEYLADVTPLDELLEPKAMQLAAAWLGRFHAASEAWLSRTGPSFLTVYDGDFYVKHAHRAVEAARASSESFAWVSALCDRFTTLVALLPAPRPTVVHGDYYVHNLLVRPGGICAIDWEMAGVDLGEMDLACLTDGWPEDIERGCERAYCEARWPLGAPADFERTMDAARLCLYFYNLGIQPDWTTDAHALWYSRRLRGLAEQMRLM